MPKHLNRRLSPTRQNYPEQTPELDEVPNSERLLETAADQPFDLKVEFQFDDPASERTFEKQVASSCYDLCVPNF